MSNDTGDESRDRHAAVVSTVLDDNTLVELVLDHDEEVTRLAVGRSSDIRIEMSVTSSGGIRLVPVSAKNNLIRHRAVLLPGPPEPYGSGENLRSDIEAYIARYVDLSPDFLRITSAYVLLSWVYDAFNELPYLRFRGDYGSGKTRALIVVGSLMHKPLFASGASTTSPIFHALDLFRGTLVIDESDFTVSDEKADLVKILNQGNVRGFPVLRSQATPQKTFDPRAFYVFGPKLVAMRHEFSDQALESRFITEEMGVRLLRSGIPINLPDRYAEEAAHLRSKLLRYRFDMRARTTVRSDCYDPSLSSRTNQVVIPLLSVVPEDGLRESIRAVMTGTERAITSDRAASPEGQLLRTLADMYEERDGNLSVGSIATRMTERFGDECDRPITARYVGYLLRKRLHLRTERQRGVFVLTESERVRVDALVARYGGTEPGTRTHGERGATRTDDSHPCAPSGS